VTRPNHLGTIRLMARQVGHQNRLLLRSRTGAFFSFVVPVMILLALGLVYGNSTMSTRGGIHYPRFFVPAIAAFAITNACYVSFLTNIVSSRDAGILKRVRGTPQPGWMYLFGRAGSAASLAVVSTVAVFVVGASLYQISFPWAQLPSLALTTLAGSVCWCSLALMVSTVVPAGDAALPVAYGTLLPLTFISDVFFPSDSSPHWLRLIASALPLRPLARSLEAPFMPAGFGGGQHWSELGVLVVYSATALLVVARSFRWEPLAYERRLRRRTRQEDRAGLGA
jgi:ABC-2 type transport system permease protein